MNLKFTHAAAAVAVALGLLMNAAFAGANDYIFEPLKAEVKKGDGVILTVRLVHKPTGKSVPDAVIVSSRIDMTPEGMPTMAAPIAPTVGSEAGTYSFKADLSMAGRWLLTVSSKVQGEQETVTGKVEFKVAD